jgi:hypothetical protein
VPLSRSDPKTLRVFNLHGIKVDRTRQRSQKMVAEARRDHRSLVICQICLNDSRNVLYILDGRLVNCSCTVGSNRGRQTLPLWERPADPARRVGSQNLWTPDR